MDNGKKIISDEQMNKDQDRLKEIRGELMTMANTYAGDHCRICMNASFLHDVSNKLLMPIKALRRETGYDAFPASFKNNDFSDIDRESKKINNEAILSAVGGMMNIDEIKKYLTK